MWLAREEQNILTPHMFTYSHANTSLGQSERARTILVIYKRCCQLYNFSFFVLNILAAWLDLFSRDPTLTSNRIFVHGFCSKFLQQKWSMKNFLRLKVFFYFVQGGSHVAGLNFKTSRVVVYKCFTSLSEIERKWFVFVQILEEGDSDRL